VLSLVSSLLLLERTVGIFWGVDMKVPLVYEAHLFEESFVSHYEVFSVCSVTACLEANYRLFPN